MYLFSGTHVEQFLQIFRIRLLYINPDFDRLYSAIQICIMSENLSLNLLFFDEHIHHDLFQLVVNRSVSQLDIRLNQLFSPIPYLTIVKKYDQHQVNLLMLAAFFGYDDIVRILLSHDKTPDHVELKGRVVISDQLTVDGATALYCSCYRGHFTVAKTLIELGHANLNQDTDDHSGYPLFLHAVHVLRRDVIDFLLENKYVDVNKTKTFGESEDTALYIAVLEDHKSLIEHLIAKGADVNDNCSDGYSIYITPIGCAVRNGHVDNVRLLYRAGAKTYFQSEDRNTLLETAVEQNYPMIIDFLLDESINTIEDLELAACSSVSANSTTEQLLYILSILKLAIERRVRLNILKVPLEAIAVYDLQRECRTVDELDSIRDDRDRMYIETLLIRERIALSRSEKSIVDSLQFYGITLVERQEFEKAFNWWIHTFYLYQRMNLHTELAFFVWLFCRMLTANGAIPVGWFLIVARMVFEPSHLEEKRFNTLNTTFLIVLATKVLEQEGLSKSDQTSIYSWIKDVCRLRLTSINGRTLLHICVDGETNGTINFRPSDIRSHIKYVFSIVLIGKKQRIPR